MASNTTITSTGETASGDARDIFGPNTTWGAYLYVGGDGDGGITHAANVASVVTSNGNLHLDPGTNKTMYLNWLSGTGGVIIGNGAGGQAAAITAAGVITAVGTGLSGTAASLNIGGTAGSTSVLTGPAHVNGSDGWFRSDAAAGWYNQTYAVGIYATEAGNVRTYNGANFIAAGTISGSNLSGTNTGDQTNISGNAASVTHNAGRTDSATYPIGWFSGGNSPAFSCSAVTIQSSTGTVNCSALTATGKLTTGVATATTAITSANYGTLEIADTTVATGATFTPFIHGSTQITGYGYRQHVTIGDYRTGTTWGGGCFVGIGGNDSYPTEYFVLGFGGGITHSSGSTFLNSSNYTSYSPSLTGGGASGSWGINISGGAATASQTAMAAGRTDSTAYPIVWGTTGSVSQLFSCSAVTIQSSTGTVNATNFVGSGAGITGIGTLGTISTINGYSPPNNAIRMTPNMHLNTTAGNAIIVNWDNGSSGSNQQLRVGNGSSVDAWYVTAAGNSTQTGSITATGIISASATGGFTSATYAINTRNPIWRFGNADAYGLSYFQGTSGFNGSSDSIGFHMGTATAAGSILNIQASGINVAGAIVATGDVTAFSDARLKKNIEVIPDALQKIDQVRGVTFERINGDDRRHTGVIAQELQAVLPEAVLDDGTGMLTVAYGNVVGLLIEAIKELNTKVEALQAQLEAQ